MIDGENSPLPILHFDADHGWPDVLKLASPFLDPGGLDRLERCLGNTARAVLVERHYIDKDYRDTFSSYHSKRFSTPDSRCIRLHFLDASLNRVATRDSVGLTAAYCGYSVIRPTRPNSIGRTLINPRKVGYVSGDMRICEELVNIQGVNIPTIGFPFISQDADVTVCAQSALWMLLRFFSNRYSVYREIYPHQITQLTRDFSIGRVVPSGGLTDWQMAEAMRQLGFSSLIYSKENYKTKFLHLLYTYIESGIPVLATTTDHAVVAFGHYSDYTKAIPAGQPSTASSFFNEGFLINNDGGIPYQRLQNAPGPGNEYAQFDLDKIEAFTAPLPEKVFLAAEQFETLVNELITQNGTFGIPMLSPRLHGGPLVTRIYLTTGKSYKRHLDQRGMGNDLVRDIYRNMPLPHFIWICELSNPQLYPQHKILGEVVWDATRNAHEQSGWLALHYPEKVFVDWGSAMNSERDVIDIDLTMSEPYNLMMHNLTHI